MALPTDATSSWTQGLGLPSRVFDDAGSTDYELYEEDEEFVLAVEMPGFDRDEITLAWDDGMLNIAAEHVDENRGRKRTYHRRFRFPKDVDDEAIDATYTNGILEVTLPLEEEGTTHGKTIPIEG
ncbi:Hsp20/alpha crystallin family protein [Halobellus limi]|uniref:HSP20 family protein n=1 Tax=Halobellus limi TaxID=699433 RepID=A0A1H5WY00_9EURY|nr:Hsp20/alpha crystallin family protein [Halobellus limi]QCC46306.1 Hsp20/alpha crystallin family protein [Halobellus limi]SEG04308.1 HSP20 family protein [Halobellus limi]